MRRTAVSIALVLILCSLVTLAVGAAAPVEMTIYYSPTCGHCEQFKNEILPRLEAEFGDALRVSQVDLTTAEGLGALESVEARLGVTAEFIPVIVVGDQLFSSEDVMGLEEPVRAAIAAAMTSTAPTTQPTPTATVGAPAASTSAAIPIHVAYIARSGCEDCARVSVILDVLRQEFPGLVVSQFDHVADADIAEAMATALGLPPEKHLRAPSLYVGHDALVGDEITSASVRALLASYAETGAPAFWEELDAQSGRQGVVERFQRMGPFAVVVAGLVDGINPCAFATILFFVSYLAISRRPRRDLLLVGLAFTAGVFAAYLAVGLGAMRLLSWANSIRWLGYGLYGLMALGCFVLAGVSVHDYVLARQGRLHEMTLNLPDQMRERIKGRIRTASRAFAGAAFVSGLLVSLMELACTGQVYLPTISFVVGVPAMRTQAVLYLVLYNVMFVVPLLVVLLLTVYGTSAARFQEWFEKHAALAKLLMAVLFVLLGALLVTQLLSL
ncbi:MAG: cytochrome c biogenesis protein CcdA [Anaerolineales bacterium]